MSGTVGGPAVAPNWYPDPSDPRMLRHWDGLQRTAHTSPASASRPGPTPRGGSNRVLWVVLSVVIGLPVLARADVGPITPSIELGGQTGSGEADWCVWVTNPKGDVKDFEYSAERGLAAGTC